MWEAALFGLVFSGFFVLRGVAATIFFYYILPESDRCPNCDAATLRMEARWWNMFFRRLRVSWCYECNWHGMLRVAPAEPARSS